MITDTQTLLSLDEYAQIMGLNPLNFNSAATPDQNTFGFESDVQPLWFKYEWQAGKQMSHSKLAELIAGAERDIANYLGVYPAPHWEYQELHLYPGSVLVGDTILYADVNNYYKTVQANWGRIQGAGQRGTNLEATPTEPVVAGIGIAFSDERTSGFNDTATITAETDVTDPSEIKLYFEGHDADPAWEIRPFRSISISSGVVTIVVDSWLMFSPDLWEKAPAGEPITINAGTVGNYVDTVDVYRDYIDTTQFSCRFIWEAQKSPLGVTLQTGRLQVMDGHLGTFGPVPATFDEDTEVWSTTPFSICGRKPDQVQLWYKAGMLSQEFRQGFDIYPMNRVMKENIAWLATARMDITFRANTNITDFVNRLRRNALESIDGDSSFFLPEELSTAPFGTRIGELRVWKRLKAYNPQRQMQVGLA